MKILNFHISQRNIMLIIVLCVAIFTFSSLGSVKEGYKNRKRPYCRRCREEHDDNFECPYMKNSDDDKDKDSSLDNMNGSYIAPAGNTVLFGIDMPDLSSDSSSDYKQRKKNKNKEPKAIPSSQIPVGDEDLYILKSEIVPPVCPACPNVTVCPNNNKPPPPCPPCARCPEPAFECKKVPNYSSNASNTVDYLPRPILTDFSQFGM
jgi:hypothetical protein